MDIFVRLLGQTGLIVFIGIVVFLFSYKHSLKIFDWIEKQTMGSRTYILEKCELLFIEVKPQHVTYVLLLLSVGNGLFIFGICTLFGHWLLGAFLALVISFIGFKIPKPFINYLIEVRINKYSSQMVDALTLLANGIRAGLSVPQSIGMIVDEMPKPISQEFNLILQQNRIGVPLEECFENLTKRVPTEDNDMFVSSVNILRETGGNLAEVFDTIVAVIRERIRLKQKIDQMTASGMFQGYVIGFMPFAIGGIFAASDPASMIPMVTTPVGLFLTFLALAMDAMGIFVIMKIVKIKI